MTERASQLSATYIKGLTAYQPHLQGYIFASLGNHLDAEDVLQRTNLTLLKKESDFPEGGEFLPWAIAIAKYEILSYIRDSRRDRSVFSPSIVEMMCDTAADEAMNVTDRQEALRGCLGSLPDRSRNMLTMRYASEKSLSQIAERTGRSIDGVKSMLFRLRKQLEQCIERKLSQGIGVRE
jgi:RNA polymerase sigma-70 factor, ECF subfamily